jgi:beta-lactamase class A
MAKHSARQLFTYLVMPALLMAIGWFAHNWSAHHGYHSFKRFRQGQYRFISPLLDVEMPEGYSVGHEPIPFKRRVDAYVQEQIRSGAVRKMSVYYRDLSDGPWFGINESIKYNPASMMKVPVMVAWLRRAEKDPAVLKQTLVYNDTSYVSPPQTIASDQMIQPGRRYTVEELLRFMIQYSDNNAMSLLYFALAPEEFATVVDNMDVTNEEYGKYDSISVHGYSGFLRILYNASYLSKEMSEKALLLMSRQTFASGLRAGVPPEVKVASKFGEFNEKERPEEIQLHEFGIVYHPKGPYILGVLTMGGNWEKQAAVIKGVSQLVYSAVSVKTPVMVP